MSEEMHSFYDDDELYRRLCLPDWVKDVEKGIISSAAFKNRKGTKDLSVDLGRLTQPEITAIDVQQYAVGMIIAGDVRNLGQEVFNNPENDNIAHSTIRGTKTGSTSKKLARKAQLILYPLLNCS